MTIQTDEYLKRVREQQTGMTSTDAAPTAMVRTNNTPVEAGVTTTPPAYSSTSGDNVRSYVERTSANLGADPGATTEAGRLYAERVTNSLKTPDASSVSAQQTEDTNAARRAYLARMDAGERVGQSGFALGSSQATRIADQSAAGVNAANQAGQNAVNAYIRQRTEDNMNRAGQLENERYGRVRDTLGDARTQAATDYGQYRDTVQDTRYADETRYSRGRDAVGDARYADETTYNRGEAALDRTERNKQTEFLNAQVLRGNDEAAKRDLLNSLPDGPAKNAVLAGLANGSLTTATALSQVMNPDGSIKEEYRGKTPGTLGLEAEKEYAIQTLQMEAEAKGIPFDPNSPEGVKVVAAKMVALRSAKDNPINDETDARNDKAAAERLANLKPGQQPDPKDLETLPSINVSAIPVKPTETARWLAENETGGWVKIGGEPYRVIRGANEIGGEAGDYVVIQTLDGQERYIRRDGTISTEKPRRAAATTVTSTGQTTSGRTYR